MKQIYFLLFFLSCVQYSRGQAVPELMYYKFDVPGTTVANDASSPVGNNPATVTGLTIGGTGQFGTGLNGAAGAVGSNNVNPGWTGTHTGSWTISFWMNVPTPPTTRYMFGNSSGNGTFRCFIGGAANGIRLTGGVPSITLDMPNWLPGTSVVTYVYDASLGTVSGYINGVFQVSASPGASYPLAGTNFYVGAQGTSIDGTMDEFRMYNRALSAAEVASTWNIPLPGGPCTAPPVAGTVSLSNATPCTGSNFSLTLVGNSFGTGQTYQWEQAASATGPFTPIGSPSSVSGISQVASATTYYRAAVTCSSQTSYSDTVLVTVPAPFPGGTYTIDAGSPASSTNFQSFSAAMAAIGCGISGPIVLNVVQGSGPYVEQIEIPATVGTTLTNNVIINGNGDTLRSGGSASNFATMNLDGADYITVKNLVIEATGATNSFALHMMNGADNNTFDSCTFRASYSGTGSTSGCVSMSGSKTLYSTAGANGSNNTFSNCSLSGGYFGFAFYGNTPAGNTNNSILNCVVKDYYVYGSYNIQQGGATIADNIFERPTRTPVSTGYGVLLTTGCTNMLVERNRVRKLWDANIGATGTTYCLYNNAASTAGNENKFYNNIVSDINFNGTIYGMYFLGGTHLKAYHNTISLDQAAASGTTTTYGIYATGTAGVDIRNNIVSITRGGAGTKQCLYFTGATGKISDNNDLYINSSGGTNYVGYYSTNSTGYATLAAWQGVNGSIWDQASESIDPVFASPAVGDYTPTSAPLDDQGTPVGITTDILGATRSVTTPDIGAIEFAVPPCVGVPVAGTAAGPASVCSGVNFTLSLSGFTIGAGINIQWESSPTGAGVWSGIGNTATLTVSQSMPMDYRAVVSCVNGGQSDISNTVSVGINPFYNCYCSPLNGTTLHSVTGNYMLNIAIQNTQLSIPTGVVAPGGYTQHSASVPTNTATLAKTVPYTINVIVNPVTNNVVGWIDYDQSGSFDASEFIQLTTAGGIASGTINVPVSAATGITGMRLRAYTTTAYTATQACSSISTGYETEDFLLTIDPVPTCMPPTTLSATNMTNTTADVSWNAVSGAVDYQWAVDLTPTGAPDAATTINTSVTNTPPTVTGLSGGNVHYLHVRTNCGSGYSLWMVYSFIPPPSNDSCGAPVVLPFSTPVNGTTYGATQSMPSGTCAASTTYANDVWYTFTLTGNSNIVLTGTNTVGDVVMETLSGTCGAMTQLDCQDSPAIGTETTTLNNLAAGTYYVRVYGFLGIQNPFVLNLNVQPLAIDLLDISAQNQGSRNRVDWRTGKEDRGDYFVVQRSLDGRSFESLAKLNTTGLPSDYHYFDETPVAGVNYYRLLMVDANGTESYSKVVAATYKGGTAFRLKVHPNPVNDALTVGVQGNAGTGQLTLTDIAGRQILEMPFSGSGTVLSTRGLAPGTYFLKYADGERAETIKIIKE